MAQAHETEPTGVVLTKEQQRRRRARSVAIGLALFAMVALFYIVTVYKLGANVVDRVL